jgi:hypothetical protein
LTGAPAKPSIMSMRPLALALVLLLTACDLAPGSLASSPYRGPTDADISHAGGGGGGGGGGGM